MPKQVQYFRDGGKMCQQGTDCPGIESHNFSPRYDISIDPQAVESIERLYRKLSSSCAVYSNQEVEEIRNLFVNKKYVRDICTHCGETREAIYRERSEYEKEVANLRRAILSRGQQMCKCDHPCHKMYLAGGEYWKVCPMGCGLPLAGKESVDEMRL
jgi:hypothetical protein